MEYDWKRCPVDHGVDSETGHVWFSTKPWESHAEFNQVRGYWAEMTADRPLCIKTVEDFAAFANRVAAKSSLSPEAARYLKRTDPDLNRLRQCVSAAWRDSCAGLTWKSPIATAGDLATLLTEAGIKCSRADVENGARKGFKPHQCPDTPAVRAALGLIRESLPSLQVSQILCDRAKGIDFTGAGEVR